MNYENKRRKQERFQANCPYEQLAFLVFNPLVILGASVEHMPQFYPPTPNPEGKETGSLIFPVPSVIG